MTPETREILKRELATLFQGGALLPLTAVANIVDRRAYAMCVAAPLALVGFSNRTKLTYPYSSVETPDGRFVVSALNVNRLAEVRSGSELEHTYKAFLFGENLLESGDGLSTLQTIFSDHCGTATAQAMLRNIQTFGPSQGLIEDNGNSNGLIEYDRNRLAVTAYVINTGQLPSTPEIAAAHVRGTPAGVFHAHLARVAPWPECRVAFHDAADAIGELRPHRSLRAKKLETLTEAISNFAIQATIQHDWSEVEGRLRERLLRPQQPFTPPPSAQPMPPPAVEEAEDHFRLG